MKSPLCHTLQSYAFVDVKWDYKLCQQQYHSTYTQPYYYINKKDALLLLAMRLEYV